MTLTADQLSRWMTALSAAAINLGDASDIREADDQAHDMERVRVDLLALRNEVRDASGRDGVARITGIEDRRPKALRGLVP
jgi:hypothetical protein